MQISEESNTLVHRGASQRDENINKLATILISAELCGCHLLRLYHLQRSYLKGLWTGADILQ